MSAAAAKFSIGIDLGTTNCALAYVPLEDRRERSSPLSIEQRDELNSRSQRPTLASFLYSPPAWEREQLGGETVGLSADGWLLGELARRQSGVAPERVAHSAKSWLAYHAVSPSAKVLPWQSKSLSDAEKLSPVEASAQLLGYLRQQWNERMAGSDPAARFDLQRVTITVPASFDAASQKATREAARLAGFPDETRLLEEPQAAFYRWLESGEERDALRVGNRILVVDIGGGTSDFSLFRVREPDEEKEPQIERIAVSDHILLGGDNIDLALAHALESELSQEDEELSADQWSHLVARSRELKEQCLGVGVAEDRRASVSLPSKGSGLLAGSRSTEVALADVREMLLEGFFPLVPAGVKPERPTGAVLEWGLPYAPDCAVTRYLAEFLSGHGMAVDAVLYNGGTLASPLLRDRLTQQLSEWNGQQARPRILSNPETDLSVARGAARYGALLEWQARPIRAGSARAIYLEIASGADGGSGRSLLAVLPKGAQAGEVYTAALPGLQLKVNQLSRFQAYQGSDESEDAVGSLRSVDPADRFVQLPPLETRIEAPELEDAAMLPVQLRSGVNELGLLQVACSSAEPRVEGSWTLDFNLRGAALEASLLSEDASAQEPQARPSVRPERVERACSALRSRLSGGSGRNLKASRILKELEDLLRCPKHEWDLALCRRLGDAALAASAERDRSEGHAESWFSIAGYLLRPGFGDPEDPRRMRRLWSSLDALTNLPARAEIQAAIMLRRLAGGLDVGQQSALFESQWERARNVRKARAERVRLLGALERVAVDRKQDFARWCLDEAMRESTSEGYPAPYLAALGGTLSRALLHAGPEQALPPERVGEAFDRLSKLDWRDARNAEVVTLFLRAARVVEDRQLNVSSRLARRIVSKLKKTGLPEARLSPLEDYLPMSRADRSSAYGESLPPGLVVDV